MTRSRVMKWVKFICVLSLFPLGPHLSAVDHFLSLGPPGDSGLQNGPRTQAPLSQASRPVAPYAS